MKSNEFTLGAEAAAQRALDTLRELLASNLYDISPSVMLELVEDFEIELKEKL